MQKHLADEEEEGKERWRRREIGVIYRLGMGLGWILLMGV